MALSLMLCFSQTNLITAQSTCMQRGDQVSMCPFRVTAQEKKSPAFKRKTNWTRNSKHQALQTRISKHQALHHSRHLEVGKKLNVTNVANKLGMECQHDVTFLPAIAWSAHKLVGTGGNQHVQETRFSQECQAPRHGTEIGQGCKERECTKIMYIMMLFSQISTDFGQPAADILNS